MFKGTHLFLVKTFPRLGVLMRLTRGLDRENEAPSLRSPSRHRKTVVQFVLGILHPIWLEPKPFNPTLIYMPSSFLFQTHQIVARQRRWLWIQRTRRIPRIGRAGGSPPVDPHRDRLIQVCCLWAYRRWEAPPVARLQTACKFFGVKCDQIYESSGL